MSKSPYKMSVLLLEHVLEAVKPDLLIVCGSHKAVVDVFVPENDREEIFLIVDDIDSEDVMTTGEMVNKLKTIKSNYSVSLAKENPDDKGELYKLCDLAQTVMLLEGTDKDDKPVIRVGLMAMPNHNGGLKI